MKKNIERKHKKITCSLNNLEVVMNMKSAKANDERSLNSKHETN
jgi:hypothetical protein